MTATATPFRRQVAMMAVRDMAHAAWVIDLGSGLVLAESQLAQRKCETPTSDASTTSNGTTDPPGRRLVDLFETKSVKRLVQIASQLKPGDPPVRLVAIAANGLASPQAKRRLHLVCRRLPPTHRPEDGSQRASRDSTDPAMIVLVEEIPASSSTRTEERPGIAIGFASQPKDVAAPPADTTTSGTATTASTWLKEAPMPSGPRDGSGRLIRIDRTALPADDRAKLDDIARRINSGSRAAEEMRAEQAAPAAMAPHAYNGMRRGRSKATPTCLSPAPTANISEQRKTEPAGKASAPDTTEAVDPAQRVRFIAHELKTPLGAIQTLAEILRDGYGADATRPLDPQRSKTYADDIVTCAIHALDVLDAGFSTTGPPKTIGWRSSEPTRAQDLAPINIAAIADATVKALQPSARARGVRLSYLGPGGTAFVAADPRSIRQILFNLVGNALKFTDTGDRITVIVRIDDAGRCVLAVRDTGRGMTPREVESRMDRSRPVSADHGGNASQGPRSGLGLKVVAELAHRDGAVMSLDSRVGVGTRVALTFPICSSPSIQPEAAPDPRT